MSNLGNIDLININVPRLLGPIRLVEYKDDYRHIYFMGDAHVIKPVCWPEAKYQTIEIQEFIEDIVKNSDDTIDLFLETPSIERDILEENNWIDKIVNRFSSYFKIEKKEKTNLRGHYVDMRRENKMRQLKAMTEIVFAFYYATSTDFKIMSPIISPALWSKLEKNLGSLGMKNDTSSRKKLFFIYLGKYIQRFDLTKKDFLDIIDDVDVVLTQIKFYKQVDNIVNEDEKEFVLKYFKNRFDSKKLKNKKVIKKFIEMLFGKYKESGENTFCGMEYSEIRLACESITLRTMDFMDCYTISRIMRSYKDAKRADKIIVYAGDDHITKYLDFFSKLEGSDKILNETTSNTEGIDYQCLNISKFKRPFFS